MEFRIVACGSPNRRPGSKVRVTLPRGGLSGPETPQKGAAVRIVRVHMLIIGMAQGQVLFFAAYTEREEAVRIISPGGQHPSRQASPDGNRSPMAATCTWTDLTDCVLRNIAHDLGPAPNLSNPDNSV